MQHHLVTCREFAHGHTATWQDVPEPERRVIFRSLDDVRARVGDIKAEWMIKQRNAVAGGH